MKCITEMFKYLGQINDLEKPILIAHNGKGFDNWLVIKNEGFLPFKILKTSQGIVDMKITNKYTSTENQKVFRDKFISKTSIKNPKGDLGDLDVLIIM